MRVILAAALCFVAIAAHAAHAADAPPAAAPAAAPSPEHPALTADQAKVAIAIMGRAQIQGSEAPVFMDALNALSVIAHPKPPAPGAPPP